MIRTMLMVALLPLWTVVHADEAAPQEQPYKGGKIAFLGLERSNEFGRDGDAWFWYEPKNSEEELIVIRLKVSLGGASISFRHKDVKLVDANGKKHDWRGVVTITEALDFRGEKNITRERWDRMAVLVDPTQGMLYMDEKNGRMLVGTERDITTFLFSVPRGTAVEALEIQKLRFEIPP